MSQAINYNHSVDIVKGWGIIAVILGHIFLGSADVSLPRYLIYAFHMPLFFFVSGYLLNIDKIGAMSIGSYFRKYAKRMLGWWFVAWIVYTVCVNLMYSGRVVSAGDPISHFLIRNIVYPWGHLWFVPSLFLAISLAYGIKKVTKLDTDRVIAILLVLSLIQMIVAYSGCWPNNSIIRYHNLMFFALGMMCKRLNIKQIPPPILLRYSA